MTYCKSKLYCASFTTWHKSALYFVFKWCLYTYTRLFAKISLHNPLHSSWKQKVNQLFLEILRKPLWATSRKMILLTRYVLLSISSIVANTYACTVRIKYCSQHICTLRYRHRIKTHIRSTQPKTRNRCHVMIRHQNADAMFRASALMRGIHPLDVRHFEYYQGGECVS
jgi:hypothetical protein